jgi:nitroreductase
VTRTPFDLETVDRLLTTTKAVRQRLDLERPVARELITECIRIGCYAPNASNAQEWWWVVVDDAEQKVRVADVYRDVLVPRVTQMLAVKESMGDEAGARISRSILYLADHLHEVPALVIPCYDVKAALERYEMLIPDPGPLGLSTHMDSGMFASVIPAVWNFQLALHSRGLGSVHTTAHQLEQQKMAAILGVPNDWFQVALIPVAYTVGDDFKPSPRKPVDDVVIWNRYDGGPV